MFKPNSKLPELRKQYPELHQALRVVERDLHGVDKRVKEIQEIAKQAELISSSEPRREEIIRSLHAEQQRRMDEARREYVELPSNPLEELRAVIRRLGFADTLTTVESYGVFLRMAVELSTYRDREALTKEVLIFDKARADQAAATAIAPADRLLEACASKYQGVDYPSHAVGEPLRIPFGESSFYSHGKVTRGMGGTNPLGVPIDIGDLDWMHLGSVRGKYSGEPGYQTPSATHNERLLREVGKFGIPKDATAAYQTVDTEIHVGSAVGVIGFEIRESAKESGTVSFLKRGLGLAAKQYELVLTIAPSSLIHSVQGQERIDKRACVVGVALPLPKNQAYELQNALRTPKDREAVFWSLFDRPPEGEAGKAIRWIRDGMILPVAQAAFGHTKPWDQLSAVEQKFALRHMVIGEANTICDEDFATRWREIRRLCAATA